MLIPGDMVRTPHGAKDRLYQVIELDHYPNGTPRALIREIGTGYAPISYPAELLTRVGYFGAMGQTFLL